MSKKTFTAEEVELLSKNKCVQNVSEKSITYSNEFKIYFIAESKKEKTSRLIFEEAGFDIGIIGEKHCEVAGARWRKAFKDKGVLGLDDTRKHNRRAKLKRELSKDEIIARKDVEIEYLKAEVEMLKKLELCESQVKRNKSATTDAFGLIESIINSSRFSNVVTHLCKTANVSCSGYYNYLKCNDKRKQREKADVVVRDTILIAFNHRGYKKGSRFINLSDKITLDIDTGTIHKLMATPGLHLDKTAFIHSDQGVH